MNKAKKKSFSERISEQKKAETSANMVNNIIIQEIDYFIDLCSAAVSKQLSKEESLKWIEEKLRERQRTARMREGQILQ